MSRLSTIVVLALMSLCTLARADLSTLARADPTDLPAVGNGRIASLEPGVLYLYGGQYKIAVVDESGGGAKVAVPVSDPLSMPAVGEEISFSGPDLDVGGVRVIDTFRGFLWRREGKDTAEAMAAMSKEVEAQAAEAAAQGIPNAVQTTIVMTPQQAAEQARSEATAQRDRLLNYTLGLLSLIVGVMAFERAQKLISVPVAWVWRRGLRRKSGTGEGSVPREPAGRGDVATSEASEVPGASS